MKTITSEEIIQTIEKAPKITILTGAGVSTDSGIPDFKTADETWPYEEDRASIISRPFFQQNPQRFWKIYKEVFGQKMNAEPNDFHYFLANIEKEHEITIITQNVDGLHSKAGSTNVFEVHGNMHYLICPRMTCKTRIFVDTYDFDDILPKCPQCRKIMKPDVSLFMEGINHYMDSLQSAIESNLFIIAGTALNVGPINEIPYHVLARDIRTIWINEDEPPSHYGFKEGYIGSFKNFIEDLPSE